MKIGKPGANSSSFPFLSGKEQISQSDVQKLNFLFIYENLFGLKAEEIFFCYEMD
jgi:hypothetical protein